MNPSRITRIINYTCTNANTWYKVFDEADYQKQRITEIKVKLRETSTADHFRYAFVASPSTYMTSTSGFTILKDVKQLYVYVPTTAGEVIEIEIQYR